MLPAEESGGYAEEARDVGERGEKNGASSPPTIDVLGASNLTVAVRRRIRPAETPSLVEGKPPKKSKLISPLAFMPFQPGPKTSRLIRDCRADALKAALESPRPRGTAIRGRSRSSTLPRAPVA